jgi:nitrous oxidase accessory protein NosD
MTITNSALQALIAAAKPGGVVHLPPGVYPPSYLRGLSFSPAVTITADPGAVLQGLVLQNVVGLTFSGLELVSDPHQGCAMVVQTGGFITVMGCNIHGSAVGDGAGVKFMSCPNSAIMDCEIHHLGVGAIATKSDHFTFMNNRVHDIEIDGLDQNAQSFSTVTGNHFTNFYPRRGDHSDAMQFQTSGQTAPATDILIENNVYERGIGSENTQGVFMGNESGHVYERVTIRGNAIIGGVYHGINLVNATDAVIADNLVVGHNDIPKMTSWIRWQSVSGQVSGNVATSLNPTTSPGAVVTNNLTVSLAAPGDRSLLAAFAAGRRSTAA